MGTEPIGHGDEDPEKKERYDELEATATDRREDLGISLDTDLLSTINKTNAILEANDLIARADEITMSSEIGSGEDFSDDTEDEAYSSLVSKVQLLTDHLGDTGRRQARESFLAAQLGFVAGDHNGATADRLLTLVSRDLEKHNLPADLDPTVAAAVKKLANCWAFDEATLFERLAAQFAEADPAGIDLADHIVFMSLAANLRSTDEERLYLWDDRSELVEYAEDLIEGMTPGKPVDLGTLYIRANSIVKAGALHPPQVAEVTRLALAALAGDWHDVFRSIVDAKVAAELRGITAQLKVSHDNLENLKSIPRTDPRLSVVRNSDFDLSEAWTYLYARRRSAFPQDSGGQSRAATLDTAIGADLPKALSDLSVACRSGDAEDVAAKARTLKDALEAAEQRLRNIIGDPANMDTQFAREADILGLLNVFRDRALTLCEKAAAGESFDKGPFDAAIAVALAQTGGTTIEIEKSFPTPARVLDGFETDLAKMVSLRKDAEVLAFRDALAQWADAAGTRRLDAEERPDPKNPNGNPITWPGLVDATKSLVSTFQATQAAAAAASPADRARFTDAVKIALAKVSARLRAAKFVNDPKVVAADPNALAALVDGALKSTMILDDPAQSWKDEAPQLLSKINRSPDLPNLPQSLAGALDDWDTAFNVNPRDDELLSTRSWKVLNVLADFRAEIKNTINDPNVTQPIKDAAQQVTELFDQIGLTIADKLSS